MIRAIRMLSIGDLAVLGAAVILTTALSPGFIAHFTTHLESAGLLITVGIQAGGFLSLVGQPLIIAVSVLALADAVQRHVRGWFIGILLLTILAVFAAPGVTSLCHVGLPLCVVLPYNAWFAIVNVVLPLSVLLSTLIYAFRAGRPAPLRAAAAPPPPAPATGW